MTDLVLETKLYSPSPPGQSIPRAELLERLEQGVVAGRALTLISAPAGYGKTTVVAMWLQQSKRFAAWVSLDQGDNDPNRFFSYLLISLQRACEELDTSPLASLQSSGGLDHEAILGSVINDLSEARQSIVLVLDDYHVIKHPDIQLGVAYLLEHRPPPLHLVITTREDPALPLARLRARGQMTELRAHDLRLSAPEAESFMHQVMGLQIPAQDVRALESRTEGWVAGLQLAALSMRESPDPAAFIQAFSGTHRHILDYLTEEVLRNQPEEVQHFLQATSILERITGPLADALTGRDDGTAMLQRLEKENLFLIPLDHERRWYRYHQLFRGLLHNRLLQTQAGLVPGLHRRAAEWHAANGSIQTAVEHALLDTDLTYAASLIEQQALPLLYRGEVRTVLGWFDALPQELMLQHPMMWISKAWALALMRRGAQREVVEAALQNAERCLVEIQADRGLRALVEGHAASIRASLFHSRADPEYDPRRLIALAQEAEALLPERDYGIRSVNALNMGSGYLELGDTSAADPAFQQAYRLGLEGGNFYAAVYGPINRAWVAFHLGQLARSIEICQGSLQEINQLLPDADQQLPPLGGLHILLGAIALEQNRLEAADNALTHGLGPIQWTGEYQMHMTGYTALAWLHHSRGEIASAEGAVKALESSWPEGSLYCSSLRMRLRLSRGLDGPDAVKLAEAWLENAGVDLEAVELNDSLAPWSVAVFHQVLTAVRVAIALARLQRDPARLRASLTRLRDWRGRAQRNGALKFVIELALIETVALDALGQRERALSTLRGALEAASQSGFLRIFLDEGASLQRLLRAAAEGPNAPEYARVVLGASKEAERLLNMPAHQHPDLVEPLSTRELEILRLMTQGLTYGDLADRLIISVNTVRYHVKGLYGKLSVSSRAQAIARARTLKLI